MHKLLQSSCGNFGLDLVDVYVILYKILTMLNLTRGEISGGTHQGKSPTSTITYGNQCSSSLNG